MHDKQVLSFELAPSAYEPAPGANECLARIPGVLPRSLLLRKRGHKRVQGVRRTGFLILSRSHKEFEERVGAITSVRGVKREMV